jgi:hypothetical protein
MPLTLYNTNNSGQIILSNIFGGGTFNASVSAIPSTPSTGSPWQSINTIISYLRNYVTDFRNPEFFLYRLDGTAYTITDGGQDMFDSGNSTAPWLRSGTNYALNQSNIAMPSNVHLPYSSQSATLTDTNYYYAAFGYTQSAGTFPAAQNAAYHPLTMIGARSGSGPIGWQKTGDIGADGTGNILTGSLYTGSVVNGFTVYAYYRQTYGQGFDPNICDVYMLLGHTNWNSNFGTVTWYANLSTLGQGAALYATGSASNLLAITTLLSRSGSTPSVASLPISESTLRTVVDNFTLRIQQSLSF